MTYTHLTTDELVIIESYFKRINLSKTAQCLNRSRKPIHNVLFLQARKIGLRILPTV